MGKFGDIARKVLNAPFVGLIRFYQVCISPYTPRSCRFTPTCSAYAADAIMVHGPCKGVMLAIGRLLRCQPFCKGGYDPVPPRKKS